MIFYDANLSYGLESNEDARPLRPCRTIGELRAALDRAGIAGGLVRTVAADLEGVVTGNRMLAHDLKTVQGLYGMYTLLPSVTHEIPAPRELPDVLRRDRMPVLRVNPRVHRYLPKAGVLADYLGIAEEAGIPVMFDLNCGIQLGEVWDIMERFPNLPAILGWNNVWPSDRNYGPFLAAFPKLKLELSNVMTDQGLEWLVKEFGAERFLFASRFPEMYMGGGMLMLRCAEISDEDKEKIAGGNFLSMIREVMGND